ncbi:MAG: hypothetical protein JWO10_1977, partial [Microbacteriaceae bacterium]|nr:hypothetical protein [Microbacteriaceae bacterium]
ESVASTPPLGATENATSMAAFLGDVAVLYRC